MEISGFSPILGNDDPTASFGNQELGRFEFLRLLVAQLSNQDPLEPVENTEFVSQVAQFSSLDELIKIRELNETSMAVMTQLLALSTPSLEGEAEADGTQGVREGTLIDPSDRSPKVPSTSESKTDNSTGNTIIR